MQHAPGPNRRGPIKSGRRKRAGHEHEAEAVRGGQLHLLRLPPAVRLRAQARGRYAHPGQPQRRGKREHGQQQLHRAQPFRTDTPGQMRLKQHGRKPKQQCRGGQQQRILKDLTARKQKITLRSIFTEQRVCL